MLVPVNDCGSEHLLIILYFLEQTHFFLLHALHFPSLYHFDIRYHLLLMSKQRKKYVNLRCACAHTSHLFHVLAFDCSWHLLNLRVNTMFPFYWRVSFLLACSLKQVWTKGSYDINSITRVQSRNFRWANWELSNTDASSWEPK